MRADPHTQCTKWRKDSLCVQAFAIHTFFLHKLLSLFSDSQKSAFITFWNISFNRKSVCSLAFLAAGCTCQRGSLIPEEMTRQFIAQHTDSGDASTPSQQLSSHSSSTGCHLHPGQNSQCTQDKHTCRPLRIRLTNIKSQHLSLQKTRQTRADCYHFSSRMLNAVNSHMHNEQQSRFQSAMHFAEFLVLE